jgi:hypothetical protein
LLLHKSFKGILGTLLTVQLIILYGCAVSGVVTDKGLFDTSIENVHLTNEPYFRLYLGGSYQKIPIKQIQVLNISPDTSLIIDRQLYYKAEIILTNGSKVLSSKDKTKKMPVFVCVENSLQGKNDQGLYELHLSELVNLKINKK